MLVSKTFVAAISTSLLAPRSQQLPFISVGTWDVFLVWWQLQRVALSKLPVYFLQCANNVQFPRELHNTFFQVAQQKVKRLRKCCLLCFFRRWMSAKMSSLHLLIIWRKFRILSITRNSHIQEICTQGKLQVYCVNCSIAKGLLQQNSSARGKPWWQIRKLERIFDGLIIPALSPVPSVWSCRRVTIDIQ